MADNIELNAGSGGATLATDDAGVAGHVQVVKLAVSADGSATPITADAGGLLVNLGTNNDVTVTGTVTVDGSGVTQPVSAASLPLPTGASTAAKQPALGTAGTASADVITVQGIASMTPLLAAQSGTWNVGTVTTVTAVTAISNALPAGTNAIGKLAANSGVDIGDVDVTSIAAGTNTIGNVGIIPRTSGGMSIFRSLDIDETEEEIKSSAGQVFSISAFNTTAAPLYLKFYNATAANVTVGSTTPVLTFVVPGNADSDGAGFIWNNDIGFAFGTAITVACTTGVADADTGAPGANACVINVGYA